MIVQILNKLIDVKYIYYIDNVKYDYYDDFNKINNILYKRIYLKFDIDFVNDKLVSIKIPTYIFNYSMMNNVGKYLDIQDGFYLYENKNLIFFSTKENLENSDIYIKELEKISSLRNKLIDIWKNEQSDIIKIEL